MKTIRQQIDERYKPGVSFRALIINVVDRLTIDDYVDTVQKDWIIKELGRGFYFVDKNNIFCHNGYIYYNGQFAPIVETEYIPKGDIEGFPIEVVNLMLKRQKEQNGKEDVSVFEERNTKTKAVGGFDWNLAKEGHSFWFKVIYRRMFDVFFERYPREQFQQPENKVTHKIDEPDRKYPRTMLVWDDGDKTKYTGEVIVDYEYMGKKYFVELRKDKLTHQTLVWQNAEDLPIEKTKVTLSEALQIVAEKLGKSVDKIEIEKFTPDELQLLWAGKKATCDKDCHCHAECPVADEYIKELTH